LKTDPNKYAAGSRLQAEWFACHLLSVDYMLSSSFDPEVGGSMIFLNVDGLNTRVHSA
jgi:hypothetical protein